VRGLIGLMPIVALGILAGCESKPATLATHPVYGQIYYDGKPAVGVRVFLYPTSAPTVPQVPMNPHGVTGADGRFTLSTFGEGDGAAEGGYQVILIWPPETTEDEEGSSEDRLFGWYSGVRSQLTVQVKPGENSLPVFNLPVRRGPPPVSEGVPGRN